MITYLALTLATACVALIIICFLNRKIIDKKSEIIETYEEMIKQYSEDTEKRITLIAEYADALAESEAKLKESRDGNRLIKEAGQNCYRNNSILRKAIAKFFYLDVRLYRNHELPKIKCDIAEIQTELTDLMLELPEEGEDDAEQNAPRSEG